MKKIIVTCVGMLLFSNVAIGADKPFELATEEQKTAYAMGMDLGGYLKGLGEDLDIEALQRGMGDVYKGNKLLLSKEEAAEVQQKFATKMQEKQIRETVAMVQKNNEAAEKFLAENKKKDGVKETASGLQYKVIKEGTGKKPGPDDTVKVHYRGTLLDGTEFDSSYKRNQPAVFKVGQVIKGWQEALQMMSPGAEYELYIPPKLAYGDRGAPPVIEPGSMLVFKVELLEVVDPGKAEEQKKVDTEKVEKK